MTATLRKLSIMLGSMLTLLILLTSSVHAQCTPNLPAIDFVGNWTFEPLISKGKNVGGTLTLIDVVVTTSVISPSEYYIFNDPGVEEIIDSTIVIPPLNRDASNTQLFDDTVLTISEFGNTFLDSDLVNVEFVPEFLGPNIIRHVLNECFDADNMPNVDSSSNTLASRFIDTLIPVGDGGDLPNMRLTLDVLVGPGDFGSKDASSGSLGGKIESAEAVTLVELEAFKAIPDSGAVVLAWSTSAEFDNAGFNLYRSNRRFGDYEKINESIIPAEGSPVDGSTYIFEDEDVKNRQRYWYYLEDVDTAGYSTFHGPIRVKPMAMYSLFYRIAGIGPVDLFYLK